MKKLVATLLIAATSCGTTFAKPGGWIKDFLNNSSFGVTSSSGYYAPQPMYYQPAPRVYYQQPVVVYERPQYYYQPQPQYVPMRPYQQNSSSFYWQGNNYNRHCR